MMRRLDLIAVSGALMAALAATVAFAQEEQPQCFLPEGCFNIVHPNIPRIGGCMSPGTTVG